LNRPVAVETVKNYFVCGERKITDVKPNDDYTLTLTFDNGEYRLYDMSGDLYGVFSKLKNIKKFKEVFIDESGNIAWDIDKAVNSKLIWNNRIDICKDSAYMASTPIESPQ